MLNYKKKDGVIKKFTIQNVPIKFNSTSISVFSFIYLQYKMFLLNQKDTKDLK